MDSIKEQLSAIQKQLSELQAQLGEKAAQLGEKAKKTAGDMTDGQKKAAAGVGAAVGLYGLYRIGSCLSSCLSRRRRLAQIEALKEDGKVHLFMFPRSPWSPSISAPCVKAEAFLRLAGIEYDVVETLNTYGSPNECVPFIVHGDRVVADSQRIIEYLTTEFHVNVDYKINKTDRALGVALVNMLAYSTSPAYYRIAFVQKPELGTTVLAKSLHVPRLFARLAVRSIAKDMTKNFNVTAAGSLTPEQFENEFLRDCEAVELQIGEKPYLFGDEPTSFDCAVYASFIPFANMKSHAEVSEAFHAVSQSPVLLDYLARLTERLYPDLEELLVATAAAQSELAESLVDPEEDSLHAIERDGEEPREVARQAEAYPQELEDAPDVEETVAGDVEEIVDEAVAQTTEEREL
ncbi:hypothetical protein AGDE_04744 [Angomonas deanei]|nr:hypothetical protein AGDE_11566 [Angomonas deanei]EPY39184.1 hypothetical protein AGDE_04744 [Angomonas deanei]|eukprot:EPY26049.1 hypothetical protein AGDE_11566 [Angomonas deanei]